MTALIEREGRVEIVSPMPTGIRVLLAVAGVFPFIAPYELLFAVDWNDYFSLAFAFALAISVGAAAVGLLFLYASVGGIGSVLAFDPQRRLLTYTTTSILRPRRVSTYSLDQVTGIDVRTHEWSEGGDSYAVRVRVGDDVLETGTSSSKEEVEAWKARVERILGSRVT
jgi:hypothetical protein